MKVRGMVLGVLGSVVAAAMRIVRGQTTLCLTGALPDGSAFEGCDGIRTPGAS